MINHISDIHRNKTGLGFMHFNNEDNMCLRVEKNITFIPHRTIPHQGNINTLGIHFPHWVNRMPEIHGHTRSSALKWFLVCWNQTGSVVRIDNIYLPSILWYKTHSIPKHNCFSSHLAVVFAQSIETSVKLRMKMYLEQRRQAMLQIHLSDQQFYCLLRCVLY